MDERIKSFREFYPFYLSEHTNPVSRKLHFIGTAFVFVILAIVIATGQGWYAAAIPIVGYGFAWAGHFFFEKNKPATFRYPLWSLASDFKLFFEILTGRRSFKP
jgi:hypothetical protein